MGEDTVDLAIKPAGLTAAASRSTKLRLHGWHEPSPHICEWERVYGSDLEQLSKISAEEPELGAALHPQLPYKKREVVWAARYEQARTTEDVLARRTRALFLNARAAIEIAPEVSQLLSAELNRDESFRVRDLENFNRVALKYIYTG
jgi:glycerol-3-phosphate dehydrogenase